MEADMLLAVVPNNFLDALSETVITYYHYYSLWLIAQQAAYCPWQEPPIIPLVHWIAV